MFTGTLFVIVKMETQMSTNQYMNKQTVHPYNGILCSNEKENTSDTCDNLDALPKPFS